MEILLMDIVRMNETNYFKSYFTHDLIILMPVI